MSEKAGEVDYTREFFDAQKDGARRSSRRIVRMVVDLVKPASVVDVGCGTGVWLNAFRENGVNELLGIDHLAETEVLEIPKSEFLDFDLRLPLKLDRKFDLVVSLEVAEHLPKEAAEVFVESLVSLGEVVLFSAAIPYQQGFHHLNMQWPEYWAEIFASKGFVTVDCIRAEIWNDDDIEPWYAQNTLLYATQSSLAQHPRLTEAWERNRGRPLAIVHPKIYVSSCNARSADPRALPLRKTLAVLPMLLSNAAARRLQIGSSYSLQTKFPETSKWIEKSRRIQGWLTDAEADQLFKLSRDFTPEDGGVIVELGSWKGKSSVMLAAGLLAKKNACLYSVDPFGLDENPDYQRKYYNKLLKQGTDVEETFERNMTECGVHHLVKALRGYSFDVIKGWTAPIDVLFIDANHEYAAVLRDFTQWSAYVKLGGIVAIHDAIEQWPGALRVVNEKLKPPEYNYPLRVDSLVWAIKQSLASTT